MKGSKKISRPADKLLIFCCTLIIFIMAGCSIKNTRSVNPYPQEINPQDAVKSPDSMTAMLRFSSKANGIKGRASLTLQSPDKIRIEIYGAMGHIVSVVAGDSNNCSVYKEGAVRKCRWDVPVLSGLITPRDLVPILLGKGELAFHDSAERRSFSDNFGRLTQIAARHKNTASNDKNNDGIRITIGDYRLVRGLRIPFSFTIEDSKEELRLRYYSLTPNPKLQHSVFVLGKTEG